MAANTIQQQTHTLLADIASVASPSTEQLDHLLVLAERCTEDVEFNKLSSPLAHSLLAVGVKHKYSEAKSYYILAKLSMTQQGKLTKEAKKQLRYAEKLGSQEAQNLLIAESGDQTKLATQMHTQLLEAYSTENFSKIAAFYIQNTDENYLHYILAAAFGNSRAILVIADQYWGSYVANDVENLHFATRATQLALCVINNAAQTAIHHSAQEYLDKITNSANAPADMDSIINDCASIPHEELLYQGLTGQSGMTDDDALYRSQVNCIARLIIISAIARAGYFGKTLQSARKQMLVSAISEILTDKLANPCTRDFNGRTISSISTESLTLNNAILLSEAIGKKLAGILKRSKNRTRKNALTLTFPRKLTVATNPKLSKLITAGFLEVFFHDDVQPNADTASSSTSADDSDDKLISTEEKQAVLQ